MGREHGSEPLVVDLCIKGQQFVTEACASPPRFESCSDLGPCRFPNAGGAAGYLVRRVMLLVHAVAPEAPLPQRSQANVDRRA